METSLRGTAVLLIAEPVNPGGIAVYTRLMMAELTKAGIRHPLITSMEPVTGVLPEAELPHVQVVRGLFWTSLRPFVFRKLVAWARKHDPALIHGLSAVTAHLCAKLAQALKVPYIVTVHHFQKRGALRAEKGCGGFIAVSEPLRENLVNDARVAKDLIHLIPTGVRIPAAPAARPAAGQPGGPGSVPLVSSFGKLIPRKDFVCFLKAARLIVDKLGPDCSFIIAGDGPSEHGLRKLARDLGMAKQVTFCHGAVACEALLADTDVYVQCSRGEGFGTMALLAMAQGVPVVATSTGGLLTLVRDGETGFLVPVGDHQALADRVLKLLTDDELRRRCGGAAHNIALADFNLDQMMSRTIALYTEVLGAPAHG